jgi:hypothetical protein
MIIKYFDEFEGKWLDISGNTGSTLTKGTDGWITSQGYSVLTLLISQSGSSAPTYTELENTLGTTYTITRTASGTYNIVLNDGLMSQGKTFMMLQCNEKSNAVYRVDTYTIEITTNGDSILNFTSFELRIYN